MEKVDRDSNEQLSDQDIKTLFVLYDRCRSEWLHYDAHVWQIPSLAIAINTFLIGQAFNPELLKVPATNNAITLLDLMFFRGMIIVLAGFFTFVLLVALVKHRLHQRAKDKNIEDIEKHLGYKITNYDFSKPEKILEVERKPFFIELWLGPLRTNHWLMGVMGLTIVIDAVLLMGIVVSWW